MTNVLVTGVTGLIGSNLALKLNSMSSINKIYGINRSYERQRVSGLMEKMDRDKYFHVFVDITDSSLVESVIAQYDIDTIFHLAAVSIIQTAENSPTVTFTTNTVATVNLLEAARVNKKVKNVIVSSSDKVYGQLNRDELPYTEDSRFNPITAYEASKACSDIMTRMYGKNFDMNFNVVRCGNVFGPRDFNIERLVPYCILEYLNNRSPLIRNKDYIREFVYVDDVVDTLIALVDKDLKGEAINIGSGVHYSMGDLANIIKVATGSIIEPTLKSKIRTVKEIDEQYLDITKLDSILGKDRPNRTKTNMLTCLKHTSDWYKEYFIE